MLVYKEAEYEIFRTRISTLKNVQNWSRNRQADMTRVEQIKNHYINENIKMVPGILSFWKNENLLLIYDGLHRYLASFPDMECIVKIHSGSPERIAVDFEHINMGVSLPMLYIEQDNRMKRLVCEDIANRLCEKYPAFVSASRRPFKYNFNRDTLIDTLSSLSIDFAQKDIHLLIFKELVHLNSCAANYISENKIVCPKKCHDHGFFLFYHFSKDSLSSSIEKVCSNGSVNQQ